ncbi:MAG TPA: hypothetical protein VJC17_01500 [Candidatus Dojkabacteria bacterium]|nr:hypothetical protein [Candidatus Dojkabacteria bacterium]
MLARVGKGWWDYLSYRRSVNGPDGANAVDSIIDTEHRLDSFFKKFLGRLLLSVTGLAGSLLIENPLADFVAGGLIGYNAVGAILDFSDVAAEPDFIAD